MSRQVADVARTVRAGRSTRSVLVSAGAASVVSAAVSATSLLSWSFGADLDSYGLASHFGAVECTSGVFGIARVVVQYELMRREARQKRREETTQTSEEVR